MKKIILVAMCTGLLLTSGCEKQKQVPKQQDIELSFEYREVENDHGSGVNKFEYRSTSKPEGQIDPNDLWYKFRDRIQDPSEPIADAIGDGTYYIEKTTSTFSMRVLYKPAILPDLDAVYASRKFEITITGVADSVWRPATPLSETVPYLIP